MFSYWTSLDGFLVSLNDSLDAVCICETLFRCDDPLLQIGGKRGIVSMVLIEPVLER